MIDTQLRTEDYLSKAMSLGSLVVRYENYEKWLGKRNKMSFKGAHNAGNDAIAKIKCFFPSSLTHFLVQRMTT